MTLPDSWRLATDEEALALVSCVNHWAQAFGITPEWTGCAVLSEYEAAVVERELGIRTLTVIDPSGPRARVYVTAVLLNAEIDWACERFRAAAAWVR